jgi:hydrogenase expression/formation protein HypE
MMGGRPRFLSVAFVIEEGLPIADLERIVQAMAAAARRAGVAIVAGDTKVVERGRGDGVSITTAGIGVVPRGLVIDGSAIRPGDAVLLSGTIGDHGMAIMSVREGLEFEAEITSDTAPLHGLVAEMIAASTAIRILRDPTRGGVAASLNEIAQAARCGIEIDETAVPLNPSVAAACEMLGLDPLLVANEGRLLAIVPESDAAAVLAAMRRHPLGGRSVRIGRIVEGRAGIVFLRTAMGGSRIVPLPIGEELPRIC